MPAPSAVGGMQPPRQINRIETLWRLVKHHWLSPSAYANFATLREHVTALLNVVGLNYRVSFS